MSKRIGFGLIVAAVVAMTAAPAAACGGLVGENGTIQLTRTTTLAAYHDGVERYVTSFEFTGAGQGGRLDRAAARRADRRSSAAATGRCSASSARSRRRGRGASPSPRRPRRRRPGAQVILQTKIDALDITVLKGGGDGGGQVGRRPRLPAHARRARGARLLRRPQPDLHGRALRRVARAAARADAAATARRSCSRSRPTSRGCRCASSASGSTRDAGRRGRRVPAHRRPAEAARRRRGPEPRAQRAGVRARCSTTCAPTRAWGGCPTRCGSRTCGSTSRRPARLRPRDLATSRRGAVADRRRCHRGATLARSSDRRALRVVADRAGRRRRCRGLRHRGLLGRRRAPHGDGSAGMRLCAFAARLRSRWRSRPRSQGTRGPTPRGADVEPTLGPGLVTVNVDMHYSKFSIDTLHVREGTTVRFLSTTTTRSTTSSSSATRACTLATSSGTEPAHPPVPGEVSVDAGAIGETFYRFDTPGGSCSRVTSPGTSRSACAAGSWSFPRDALASLRGAPGSLVGTCLDPWVTECTRHPDNSRKSSPARSPVRRIRRRSRAWSSRCSQARLRSPSASVRPSCSSRLVQSHWSTPSARWR